MQKLVSNNSFTLRKWCKRGAVAIVVVAVCLPQAAWARPGGGGGGRAGGGGGRPSGGSRPSAPSRPSTSKPAPSRPAPTAKPSPATRPSAGGNAGKNLPSQSGKALSGAAAGKAATSRPAAGAGLSGKAGTVAGGRATGSRPTQGQVQDFLKASGGGAAAGNAKSRVDAAKTTSGAAVSEFLGKGGGAATGAAAATSPQNIAGARSDAISNRTDARSDVRGSRGENRNFASENRQDRVSGRGDRQSVRVENRGDVRSDLAAGRSDRRTTRQQAIGAQADNLRSQMNQHYNDNLHQDFWSGLQTGHYYFDKNPIFWSWVGFSTVSRLMPWNWGEGRYYDYGSGGSSYYDGSTVMADGTEVPVEEYAQQAEELALSVPEENAEASDAASDEWLPLGVFAVAQEGEAAPMPSMFMQLAIRSDGVIAGTYQNKETGETAGLEGMVDQESQRAAWTFTGRSTPIIETGIQNLTMNETQVLAHFADKGTKTYLLVPVENPEASAK